MLRHTFVHIPSIGYVTERRLWERGIDTWDHALCAECAPSGFCAERWTLIQDTARSSVAALDALDHRYFADLLSARDQWRAYPDFNKRIGYLDIETDGLGEWNQVTVVGVYDGVDTHTYVAGENLDQFAEDIEDYALLVTFNGATFDLPFLRRRFGSIFAQLHIDLRFALARIGHRGGLKAIERRLGLARDDDIADINGEDAVRLWHEYQRGSQEALELLVAYNRADVVNLERLMVLTYDKLWSDARGLQGADS